jgi:peroxiredoxin (alkyl hydroperoxide reductase subunit C)
MSYINAVIPQFKLNAYKAGQFIQVTQDDFLGKWNVLFFYPADFTFVCPTELADLQDYYAELKNLGVEVYGVSHDTHFVHKAWHDASETIKKVEYALIGDPNHVLTSYWNNIDLESGLPHRLTVVFNTDGQAQIVETTAEGIGRDAAELVRKIKAAIYVANNPGQVCPAKWKEGAATLTPTLDLVGKI